MNLHSLGPEPSASANSATSAYYVLKFYTAGLSEAERIAFSADALFSAQLYYHTR